MRISGINCIRVFFPVAAALLIGTASHAAGETEPATAAPTIAPPDSTVNDSLFEELDELVVVQRHKLIENDGAKLTYNVTEDPESGSSNILDILRKVPGVTVDANENVKVNGKSSFKILMNGREDPMLKGDIKTVLKSLPAASIKKIEVISEPGAKYDAEGVGGILNIVTDRSKTLSGFMTQFGLWANAYQAGGYVSARTKLNKVMLSASVSYNDGRLWPRENTSESGYESFADTENHLLSTGHKLKNGWDYTGVNLNMSWEPDTLNLFTLNANYGYNFWYNRGPGEKEMKNSDLETLWRITRDIDATGRYHSAGILLSYQHSFGRDDHTLVGSYEFDYGRQDNRSSYETRYLQGTGGETPYSLERYSGDGFSHIFQIDYADRLRKIHLIEAGLKINLNDNGGFTRAFFGPDSESLTEAAPLSVKMNQLKDIYSVYGSYSATFGKWNLRGGLRYEHTRTGIRYKIGGYDNFTAYLNDLVPNASVSFNLASASNMRFGYQMRIGRPGLNVLNPYVNTLTPGQITYGNPNLKSSRAHTFSLSYSNYEGAFSGSAKLTYRYSDNDITDIIFMKDGVMNTTYANVGMTHIGMLDLSGEWKITNDIQWSMNASGSYTHMRADSELLKATAAGWQTNLSTGFNYTLPSKYRLSAFAGLWTPWRDLQSKGTENGYYYSLGASKSWLKDDALTVQLSASNFLPARRTSSYVQEDETVRYTYRGRYSQWNVGVSVSFRFGGLKTDVKRTAASVEKEEAAGGGGKNR